MFLLSRLGVSKGEEEVSNVNMNASSGSSSSSGSRGREVGEKEREGRGNASDTKMKSEKERKKVLEKMEERQRKWELTVVGYDYVQCGVYCIVCV